MGHSARSREARLHGAAGLLLSSAPGFSPGFAPGFLRLTLLWLQQAGRPPPGTVLARTSPAFGSVISNSTHRRPRVALLGAGENGARTTSDCGRCRNWPVPPSNRRRRIVESRPHARELAFGKSLPHASDSSAGRMKEEGGTSVHNRG